MENSLSGFIHLRTPVWCERCPYGYVTHKCLRRERNISAKGWWKPRGCWDLSEGLDIKIIFNGSWAEPTSQCNHMSTLGNMMSLMHHLSPFPTTQCLARVVTYMGLAFLSFSSITAEMNEYAASLCRKLQKHTLKEFENDGLWKLQAEAILIFLCASQQHGDGVMGKSWIKPSFLLYYYFWFYVDL